jgi:hypothetical protein
LTPASRAAGLRIETIALALAALIVGVQGTFFHVGMWNQNARLAAAVAFVEPGTPYTGTFRIDGLKDGARLPTSDWAESGGAFYSNKAPGVSLLGVVPYFALYHVERFAGHDPTTVELTRVNAFALNLWISALWNVIAALALLRRLPLLGLHSTRGAAVVATVYSLATVVLPFGCSEWGHSTAAAFITMGTLDLATGSSDRPIRGGLWLGMAVLTEYLAAVTFVTAATLLLIGTNRAARLKRFAIGAALPLAVLLLYQKILFGGFFTTASSMSNPVFLEPGKIAGLFSLPEPGRLVRLLFGRERGMLWQMPILFACVPGVVAWYRSGRRAFLAFALANICLYALSITAMGGYQGGRTTSMRYMIVALPFFCMLMPDIDTMAHRRVFLVLFALSAANCFVLAGTSTMYDSEFPLSEFAYRDFWQGNVSFNPLLARLGVQGMIPAFAVAAVYAAALEWLLRGVLSGGDRGAATSPVA